VEGWNTRLVLAAARSDWGPAPNIGPPSALRTLSLGATALGTLSPGATASGRRPRPDPCRQPIHSVKLRQQPLSSHSFPPWKPHSAFCLPLIHLYTHSRLRSYCVAALPKVQLQYLYQHYPGSLDLDCILVTIKPLFSY